MAIIGSELLVEGLPFIESPRWHDGRLWFASFGDNAVYSLLPSDQPVVEIQLDETPGGIAFHGREIAVVLMASRKIMLMRDGQRRVFDLSDRTPYPLNDMTAVGDVLYCGALGFEFQSWAAQHGLKAAFGDPGAPRGHIFVVGTDGTVRQSLGNLRLPNGMVVTSDGTTLIVAETLGQRLSAFPILDDGRLGERRTWAAIPRLAPDGLCLDRSGAIWCADGAGRRCIRIGEGGSIWDIVPVDGVACACALGGHDGRDLFVMVTNSVNTAEVNQQQSGRIRVARVPIPSGRAASSA